MIPISQKIYALKEIWEMDFEKYPMASFYNEYPFLLFENLFTKEEADKIISQFSKNYSNAKLVGKGLDKAIRKTILHTPTPEIREFFDTILRKVRDKIENFFGVSLFKGSDIQLLHYVNGGFYKCHSDNASEIRKSQKLLGYKVVRPERKITTLLFLNDNFEGGEIEFCHLRYFDGKRVIHRPRVGEMIVFPSHSLFAHEVKEVKGERFAIVKWWDTI